MAPPSERQVFTVQVYLDRVAATDPALIDRARADLRIRVDRHVISHGWIVAHVVETTDPPDGPGDPVLLRLEALLVPRTDGEWPSIRQALLEDQADRLAAKLAASGVNDRLDALREAVDLWGDRELRGRWRPPEGTEERVPCRPTPL